MGGGTCSTSEIERKLLEQDTFVDRMEAAAHDFWGPSVGPFLAFLAFLATSKVSTYAIP